MVINIYYVIKYIDYVMIVGIDLLYNNYYVLYCIQYIDHTKILKILITHHKLIFNIIFDDKIIQ